MGMAQEHGRLIFQCTEISGWPFRFQRLDFQFPNQGDYEPQCIHYFRHYADSVQEKGALPSYSTDHMEIWHKWFKEAWSRSGKGVGSIGFVLNEQTTLASFQDMVEKFDNLFEQEKSKCGKKEQGGGAIHGHHLGKETLDQGSSDDYDDGDTSGSDNGGNSEREGNSNEEEETYETGEAGNLVGISGGGNFMAWLKLRRRHCPALPTTEIEQHFALDGFHLAL